MGCCASTQNDTSDNFKRDTNNPVTNTRPDMPKVIHRILMTTTSASINEGYKHRGPAKIRLSSSTESWEECFLVLKGNYLFSGARRDGVMDGRPSRMIVISDETSITGGPREKSSTSDALLEEDEDIEDDEDRPDYYKQSTIGNLSMSMGINMAPMHEDPEEDKTSTGPPGTQGSVDSDDSIMRIEDVHSQVWEVIFDIVDDSEEWATLLKDTVANSKLLMKYPELLQKVHAGNFFAKKNYQGASSIFGSTKQDANRFVQVNYDCTAITWQKVEEEIKEEYDEIKVEDVTDIVRGANTNAFKRAGKKVDARKAFSIISDKRTLDLIAQSEEERDEWVTALQGVLKFGTGYGGLEATKKALEERGDALLRIVEKSRKLQEAAEQYSENMKAAKQSTKRGTFAFS